MLSFLRVNFTPEPLLVWVPGWGGTAHGLLPLAEDAGFGSHILMDPVGSVEPLSQNLSMEDMAQAVINTLDAEKVRSFHLAGISMGGIIAQCMASLVPERIRSLHLLCTNTGGLGNPYGVLPEVRQIWWSKSKEGDPLEKMMRPCFAQENRDTELYRQYLDHLQKTPNPPSGRTLRLQWDAMTRYSSASFLASLPMPISHYRGLKDEVIGSQDSDRLQSFMPQARQFTYAGGHLFFMETRQDFLRDLEKNCR